LRIRKTIYFSLEIGILDYAHASSSIYYFMEVMNFIFSLLELEVIDRTPA
jgi:hypothetical protein